MHPRAAAVLLAALAAAGVASSGAPLAGRRSLPPALFQPARPSQPTPAAARAFIVAAEDNRIVLPDGLHTPAIDALRLRLSEDLRGLLDLTRSTDPVTQARALRALGRYERRELVTDLLAFVLPTSPRDEPGKARVAEAAQGVAQSFRGDPLPSDPANEQVQGAFEALAQVGNTDIGQSLGAISRSIGRLPYTTAPQVQAADLFLLTAMRRVEPDPLQRFTLSDITRGVESLARLHGRLAPLSEDTIEWLRRIVLGVRSKYDPATRLNAMAALVAARGVDVETLRHAVGRDGPVDLRRLAAVTLGGAGATVVRTERADLLAALLSDPSPIVRLEAVRAWARREAPTSGCLRISYALKDPNTSVVLAAIDALGESCRDDVNMTDRLAVEARTPPPNDWHRESHALLALARRAPARVVIPLLGGFVSHPTWQVRMYAARAAALVDEVTALERLAYDPVDNVREAALGPLRRLKGDEAEPYFLAALARPDYQLLRTAAIELKGTKPTSALAGALAEALRRVTAEGKETSRDTRMALLERLREIGVPDQAGNLLPLLDDFDVPVAFAAAQLLHDWTGKAFDIAPQPRPRLDTALAADLGSPPARIKLGNGRILHVSLLREAAPLTAGRFIALARAGYYDGLTFHRVLPNFAIQGGSPGANEYSADGPHLRDEISLAPNRRGSVGLSTRGRDTGDAQFFINLVDNPRLDFDYTVFGDVIDRDLDLLEGIDEGERIVSVTFDTDEDDKKEAPAAGALPSARR
jgi:cyclophilin family peptidyl-prolyl cis-trans isomerase/HEAT repeat protein